jgi:hypothetical protein
LAQNRPKPKLQLNDDYENAPRRGGNSNSRHLLRQSRTSVGIPTSIVIIFAKTHPKESSQSRWCIAGVVGISYGSASLAQL